MTLVFLWQTKDGSGDAPFPPVKDVAQFHVAHARSSKVPIMENSISGNALDRVFKDNFALVTLGVTWQSNGTLF